MKTVSIAKLALVGLVSGCAALPGGPAPLAQPVAQPAPAATETAVEDDPQSVRLNLGFLRDMHPVAATASVDQLWGPTATQSTQVTVLGKEPQNA